ncbi:MAG: permease [Deltaproteobacteria bacterium]|nr:permease [Deltaproteobacteria bacterium]
MDETSGKTDTKPSCCSSQGSPHPDSSSMQQADDARAINISTARSSAGGPQAAETSAPCCNPHTLTSESCRSSGASAKGLRDPRALALGVLSFLALTLAAWAIIQGEGWGKAPLAGIAILVGEGTRILGFVARAVWKLLPFFVLSVGLAGWLKVSGLTDGLHRVFEHRQSRAIVLSSLLGSLTPFCSCGVIPIIASMLVAGVPLAPIMSFWISSPLMNPQVFFITMGTLGASMALARLVTALIMGLAAGFITLTLVKMGYLQDQLRPGIAGGGCGCSAKPSSSVSYQQKALLSPSRWHTFITETGSISLFLGKWLLVAFVLEALITFYVPGQWIYGVVGSQNRFSVLIGTLVGIPAYMNSLAAIPVVQGLVQSGMGQGAALAFFTAGAVTAIPAIVPVLALVRRATFAVYLCISFFGALAAGTVYGIMPW